MSDLEAAIQAGEQAMPEWVKPGTRRYLTKAAIDAAIQSGELIPASRIAEIRSEAYQWGRKDGDTLARMREETEVERLRVEWQNDNFDLNQQISRLALENGRLRDEAERWRNHDAEMIEENIRLLDAIREFRDTWSIGNIDAFKKLFTVLDDEEDI